MISVKKVENYSELELCSKVRKAVYGDDEGAPAALYIIDELDSVETTVNYLLFEDNNPVSTIRYIKTDDNTVKLQRLATLVECRKKGYGRAILNALEKDIISNGYKKIILDSAEKSVNFYLNNGYRVVSDIFYEDNRPHKKMEKLLVI